jgi:Fe-S cluster biogenesis protein NfuA
MPSWFSKVFKNDAPTSNTNVGNDVSAADAPPSSVDFYDDEEEAVLKPRRVVFAPVLVEEEETSAYSPEIRIKAKVDERRAACVFMVDRPVLAGLSFWCPDAEVAQSYSPLATAIFDVGGVESVLIHDMTVTVTRDPTNLQPWEQFAKNIGAQIRAHLLSGMPVVDPDFLSTMPSAEEIRERLQEVLDEMINPGIAAHSGFITINRVVGNTVYITMGGGCQGCAASSITLRQGVEQVFRQAVPHLGAILDETDHAAGVNPYFRTLPM